MCLNSSTGLNFKNLWACSFSIVPGMDILRDLFSLISAIYLLSFKRVYGIASSLRIYFISFLTSVCGLIAFPYNPSLNYVMAFSYSWYDVSSFNLRMSNIFIVTVFGGLKIEAITLLCSLDIEIQTNILNWKSIFQWKITSRGRLWFLLWFDFLLCFLLNPVQEIINIWFLVHAFDIGINILNLFLWGFFRLFLFKQYFRYLLLT